MWSSFLITWLISKVLASLPRYFAICTTIELKLAYSFLVDTDVPLFQYCWYIYPTQYMLNLVSTDLHGSLPLLTLSSAYSFYLIIYHCYQYPCCCYDR